MKFTFGVCYGSGFKKSGVHLYHDYLLTQQMPEFELLLIGGDIWERPEYPNVRYLPFDEYQKPKAWITRKKNIIAQEAKYENIVFLHDYIYPDPVNWYRGWQDFGEDFEVAINPVLINTSASGHDDFTYRHSDWLVDPYLLWEEFPYLKDRFWELSLPYNLRGMERVQYISGGYWVAKKEFMLKHPLNEDLLWGDAEDIEWSRRVREVTTFKLNGESITWVKKQDKWKPGLLPDVYRDALVKKYNLELRYED